MITPTTAQLITITQILEKSIDQLILKDNEIFIGSTIVPQNISEDAGILMRELHETTINHRLALYIELNLRKTEFKKYHVDIEYNRYYGNLKKLSSVTETSTVRPDIIVHTRTNMKIEPQHLLVIETKKGNISPHDLAKIKGFICEEEYNYLFGLTISYCKSENEVLANLYFYNGTEIICSIINRKKLQLT